MLGHFFLPSSAVVDPRPEGPTPARRGENPGQHQRSPCRDCTEPGGTGRVPAASVHLLEQWEGQLDTSWACSCPLQSTPVLILNFLGYKAHRSSCSTSDFRAEGTGQRGRRRTLHGVPSSKRTQLELQNPMLKALRS